MQSGQDDRLTHLNAKGEAHMVNICEKDVTLREAIAEACLSMKPETLDAILSDKLKKGDVLSTARIAGIMAAKRTHELIPLCHNIPLDSVEVELLPLPPNKLEIKAYASCSWRTGVEMEAMTAAGIAALTVYDMCKAIDRAMEIEHIRLIRKSGGKSGLFVRGNP